MRSDALRSLSMPKRHVRKALELHIERSQRNILLFAFLYFYHDGFLSHLPDLFMSLPVLLIMLTSFIRKSPRKQLHFKTGRFPLLHSRDVRQTTGIQYLFYQADHTLVRGRKRKLSNMASTSSMHSKIISIGYGLRRSSRMQLLARTCLK